MGLIAVGTIVAVHNVRYGRKMVFELIGLIFPALAVMAAGFNQIIRKSGGNRDSMSYILGVFFPSLGVLAIGAMMVPALLLPGAQNTSIVERLIDLWPFVFGWVVAVAILWWFVWRRRI